MDTGRENMLGGTIQQGRGSLHEMEGRVERELGRGRFNLGRWMSGYEGVSSNNLMGGLFAFTLTALAVSVLLFPNFRTGMFDGIGRRTGLYRPQSRTERAMDWGRKLYHKLPFVR